MFKTITLCENYFGTRDYYPNRVGFRWASPTHLLQTPVVVQYDQHRLTKPHSISQEFKTFTPQLQLETILRPLNSDQFYVQLSRSIPEEKAQKQKSLKPEES